MAKVDVKKHDQPLYDYTEWTYCGVLVTKRVMKKLCRLQSEHLSAVKRLLLDEADEGNVFPSMWTLHYPNGEQTEVRFTEESEDVNKRIKSVITANQPRKYDLVFIADSMDEAREMADSESEDEIEESRR